MGKSDAPPLPLRKAAIKLDMPEDAVVALEATGGIKVTIRDRTGEKMYHMTKIQQGETVKYVPFATHDAPTKYGTLSRSARRRRTAQAL